MNRGQGLLHKDRTSVTSSVVTREGAGFYYEGTILSEGDADGPSAVAGSAVTGEAAATDDYDTVLERQGSYSTSVTRLTVRILGNISDEMGVGDGHLRVTELHQVKSPTCYSNIVLKHTITNSYLESSGKVFHYAA